MPLKRTRFDPSGGQQAPQGRRPHRRIAVSPAVLPGGIHQPFDLSLRQVLAGAQGGIGRPLQHDCSVYDGWRDEFQMRFGVSDPPVPLRASWYLSPLLKVNKFSFTLKSIQQMMGRPTPITWNHRVLLIEEHGEKSYCIHEVHYNEDNSVMGWTQNAIAVFVPSFAELILM